jgi:hypothetical protein
MLFEDYEEPRVEEFGDMVRLKEIKEENEKRYKANVELANKMNEALSKIKVPRVMHDNYPPRPPEMGRDKRAEVVKQFFGNVNKAIPSAIEYLAKKGKYCVRDYKYEDSVKYANDKAEEEEIERRRMELMLSGKDMIMRLAPGYRMARWNGVSDTDTNGQKVKWKRTEMHSFMLPDVEPVVI